MEKLCVSGMWKILLFKVDGNLEKRRAEADIYTQHVTLKIASSKLAAILFALEE